MIVRIAEVEEALGSGAVTAGAVLNDPPAAPEARLYMPGSRGVTVDDERECCNRGPRPPNPTRSVGHLAREERADNIPSGVPSRVTYLEMREPLLMWNAADDETSGTGTWR